MAQDKSAAAYAALASYLDLVGRPAEGLAVAKEGATSFPLDPDLLAATAQCVVDVDRHHQAMAICRKALARFARGGATPHQLAEFHLILAEAEGTAAQQDGLIAIFKYAFGVRAELEKAVALDPSYARGIYGLAMYDLEAPIGGNPALGLPLLEKARHLDPDDYSISEDFISQLAASGHVARARKELARFRQVFAGVPAAMRAIEPSAAKLP